MSPVSPWVETISEIVTSPFIASRAIFNFKLELNCFLITCSFLSKLNTIKSFEKSGPVFDSEEPGEAITGQEDCPSKAHI